MDRFEVIESKHWVRDDGRTASIYGALPWVTEHEKPRWKMVTRGYTVRDNERGTVGIGRQPWATRAEAQAWVDKETARLEEARRWHEANYPKKTPAPRSKRSHATKKRTSTRAKPRKEIRRASVTTDYFRGQTYGDVEWEDGSVTSGPLNTHMRALLERARREGKSVRHKTIGA